MTLAFVATRLPALEGLYGPEGAAEWRFSALSGEFGEFGEIRQNQVGGV
jgi:hypothetical protein